MQKEDDRIPGNPVNELFPGAGRQIFLYGHRPDIAHPAAFQITTGGVVQGVLPAPVEIRGEGQDAGDETGDVVELLALEERAMATVVEDNEDADHKEPIQKGQQQGDPVGAAHAPRHQSPDGAVGNDGVDDLPGGAADGGALELGDNRFPFGDSRKIRVEAGGRRGWNWSSF